MLVIGRPVVIAGIKDGGVDRGLMHHRVTGMAAAFDQQGNRTLFLRPRPEPTGPGKLHLKLAVAADSMDHLLIFRPLGKHRQFQHGACAAGKINNDIAAVPDVRGNAVIGFVQMVYLLAGACHHPHRIGFQDQPHQVEEMAAFLDKGAAGIGGEPVPVVHLLKEREAVFGDAEHADAAGDLLDHLEELLHWRHVAIFHRHPDRCAIAVAECLDAGQVGRVGEERFFHKDRQGHLCGDGFKLFGMTMVRADDEKTVQGPVVKKRVQAFGHVCIRCQRRGGSRHLGVGLVDRADMGTIQQCDILHMLAPHHAAANYTIGHIHPDPRPSHYVWRATKLACAGSNQLCEYSTLAPSCAQPIRSTYPAGAPACNGN